MLLAVFATLIACELVLRATGPDWLTSSMAETAAGRAVLGETPNLFAFVEKEGSSVVRFRPLSAFAAVDREYRNDIHITPWGTRVTGADAIGSDVVAFAGDSFTFGLGVNDRETFVSLTCRTRHLHCLNAGIPGTSLAAQLDLVAGNFEHWGRPGRVVFVFFAGNDLPELIRETDQRTRSTPPPSSPMLVSLDAFNRAVNSSDVFRRSYLLRFVKTTARAWAMPDSMDLMFVTAAGAHGDFGRAAEAALSLSLDRLERLSAQLGFRASFIVLPDRYQVYRPAMIDKARYYRLDPDALDMTFPQRLLRTQLERRGIESVDAGACLDSSRRDLYYEYDNHLTAAGHAAVATCVEQSSVLDAQ